MTELGDRNENPDRFDRIEQQLAHIVERVDQRFDSVDQRFDSVDQRFDSVDQRFESMNERMVHTDLAVDRLLTLVMDHGRDITEIKGDLRQMRVAFDGFNEAFTEHLGWHLGRSEGA